MYSPLISSPKSLKEATNPMEDKLQRGIEMLKGIPMQDLDDMIHMYHTGGQSGMKEFFFRKALDEIEDRFANNDMPPDTQTLLKTLRKRKYNHKNALQKAKRVFDIAAMPSLRELSSIAKNAG